MFTIQNILFGLSVLLSALIAGLLYGYSCSVNPGLGKLSDIQYLSAMQSINREIQNPYFFISFMGALFILPITAWHSFYHAPRMAFYLLVAASLSYIIGVMGVTAMGNIPLNERLAKASLDSANGAVLSNLRALFEASWNRYHLIRTGFSILTLILAIFALLRKS
jgi:uncharacterized membrane protein